MNDIIGLELTDGAYQDNSEFRTVIKKRRKQKIQFGKARVEVNSEHENFEGKDRSEHKKIWIFISGIKNHVRMKVK